MKADRADRASFAAFAVLVITLLFALALTACGNDQYSGMWKLNVTTGSTITIEKRSDGWTLTDSLGRVFPMKEVNGKLATTNGRDVFERVGDTLVVREDGASMVYVRAQ